MEGVVLHFACLTPPSQASLPSLGNLTSVNSVILDISHLTGVKIIPLQYDLTMDLGRGVRETQLP